MKAENNKPAILMTRFPYESSWGGEESHTLNFAQHFREKGYEVIFMGSCPVLLEKFQEKGFPVRKVWGGKMIVSPWELLKSFFLFPFIIRSLKKNFETLSKKYDIKALYCLSLNEKIFLSPVALQRMIPVTWVEHQEIRNWLIKNPWRSLYKKYGEKVQIVPISKKNERVLIDELSVPKENISEIVNGINVEEIQKLKRETQKGLIVAANRLIPKKGIMDLLSALSMMKNQLIDKHVIILGEGEEEKTIRDFAARELKELDIEFQHFLKKENWRELLSKADVYVSCARDSNETFSLNTAEALAAGCKAVVTSCSGIADFLEDKKEAFLCEPKNPSDLAEKIQDALSAPEEMREGATKAAQEKFNQSRMLKEYYTLILREK